MMDISTTVESIKRPLPLYSGYSGPAPLDDNLMAETSAKPTQYMVVCIGLLRKVLYGSFRGVCVEVSTKGCLCSWARRFLELLSFIYKSSLKLKSALLSGSAFFQ